MYKKMIGVDIDIHFYSFINMFKSTINIITRLKL